MDGKKALVTGAGGFIGHYLVTYLVDQGYWVRGVDRNSPEHAATNACEFLTLDLRHPAHCTDGRRETPPATIGRNVAALAVDEATEIRDDGQQMRTFKYLDDCVEGIYRIMCSDYRGPHNAQDPRDRNTDGSLLRSILGWEPSVLLDEQLGPTTCRWMSDPVARQQDYALCAATG